MIDLHTHILPRLDDGPDTFSEAVEICKQSWQQGVSTLVATPHLFHPKHHCQVTELQQFTALLNEVLEKHCIQLRVLPGCEIHVNRDLANHYLQRRIIGLNNSRYALLEFPVDYLPSGYQEIIYELQLHNLVPILAHPERNKAFLTQPDLLQELIEKGCLVQITASSITGLWGKSVQQFVLNMIEHHWAHVVATDVHHADSRRLCLQEAAEKIASTFGQEMGESLTLHNPQAIIADKPLTPDPPEPFKTSRLSIFTRWLRK